MSSFEYEHQAPGTAGSAASRLVAEQALTIGRVCMALLGTQPEAEEALRETLQAALDEMEPISGVASRRAWLVGIARRVCAGRVEMRFTAGLDFAEVGRACAIDEAGVRKRISRGLVKLRALSSEDER